MEVEVYFCKIIYPYCSQYGEIQFSIKNQIIVNYIFRSTFRPFYSLKKKDPIKKMINIYIATMNV